MVNGFEETMNRRRSGIQRTKIIFALHSFAAIIPFFYSILAAAELAAITLLLYLHILMLNRNTIFYFNVVLIYIY